MNKAEIIERVKQSKTIYKSYYYVASAFVNLLKLFCHTDDKLVLFVSYGGRYYNDSPKCLYEQMKEDKRFKDYKLVWAFRNPDDYEVEKKIRIDSFSYYLTALKARCWVTNVNIERGLNFLGKNTYYFHTTHGTLPKLGGNDVREGGFFGWDFNYRYDCSCAQSEEEKKYQLSMFNLKPEQVLVCGYPKNDRLASVTHDEYMEIRKKLGISEKKKAILYAPTFRENNPTSIQTAFNFSKWKDSLGKEYVILFRAHPIIMDSIHLEGMDDFVIDVTTYQDNTDLMVASDMLISDYSGIFFEYAILNRPMYCFAYDYAEYEQTRGLYFDIRKELPGGEMNEDEIIDLIKSEVDVMNIVRAFKEKYVTEYGHATERAIDNIYEHIRKR